MLMTPLRNLVDPIRDPQNGPNACSAHITNPPLPGKAVASSAVMRASGILHMKGKIRNPRIA